MKQFDKTLYQPCRLATISHLVRCGGEERLMSIGAAIGVRAPLLSTHARLLADAGYIEIRKSFVERRARTVLVLTPRGRQAFADHKAALSAMLVTGDTAAKPQRAIAGRAHADRP